MMQWINRPARNVSRFMFHISREESPASHPLRPSSSLAVRRAYLSENQAEKKVSEPLFE